MTSAIGKRGLTFIELFLVILIIGGLTAVSIPQFKKTFENFELENFVKDLYYLSHNLQASAVNQARVYVLNISPSNLEFQGAGKVYKAPKDTLIYIEPADKINLYFYPDASTDKVTITLERYQKRISLIFKGVSGGIQIQ